MFILQHVSWLASNKLTLSSLFIQLLVFSAFNTLSVKFGPSTGTASSDASTLLHLVTRLAFDDDTFSRNGVILRRTGTEYLVASSSSTFVSLWTRDSLTFVNSLNSNKLEVLSARVSDALTVDHLVAL